jgi:hypothetical protein
MVGQKGFTPLLPSILTPGVLKLNYQPIGCMLGDYSLSNQFPDFDPFSGTCVVGRNGIKPLSLLFYGSALTLSYLPMNNIIISTSISVKPQISLKNNANKIKNYFHWHDHTI